MDFLSLNKSPLLLKMPLYTEVPGSFDSLTNPPLDHGLDPGKKEIEAIESLTLGRRGLAGIRRLRWRGRPGKR
jgi:hypothetical protein